MDFQLENFHRNIPNDELIADLKKADEVLRAQGRTLNYRTDASTGRFSARTFAERFGTWNNALAAAGLSKNQEKNVSVDALFENLRKVWVTKVGSRCFVTWLHSHHNIEENCTPHDSVAGEMLCINS